MEQPIKEPNVKIIKSFRRGEPIVGLIEHKGVVFVATSRRIFRVQDDRLIPLKIEEAVQATR